LELLQKALDDMDNLAHIVLRFTNWWFNAETMLSNWGQLRGIREISSLRLGMVQKEWEMVRNRYEDYKRSVSFPRLYNFIY